ncbi:apolipoprotein N-acyltransferase [Alkalisalibacterium limincola]|uniref:Apolipoprotein N-acyltransferase n=1 Tax=Alkalisalibacterium limincola TaxID=2699169 RepID=A0A5C8KJR6_9GAMM|nr:apolipoprotein N-acyltransferase [Alkalisalibacterium limincola]TXK60993.1 apolipoprotein N-acyltransferase [Alkalisalibacterium limincola]
MAPDIDARPVRRGHTHALVGLGGILGSAVLLALYARGGHALVLGFIVLVPWLLALDATRSVGGTLLSAWLMSVAFAVAVFTWFGAAIGAYTGIGAPLATLALYLLAPLLQPQLLVFALVRHLVGRRHGALLRALAGASAWVACEALWPKLLGDTLGQGLAPSPVLRQFADLGGAAGITFVLILVAEAVATAIARRRRGLPALAQPVLLAAALVVGMAGYGWVRLSTLHAMPAPQAEPLRVAMVQASITDYEALREEIGAYGVVRHVLDTHYALSQSAIRDHGADVLLWSETVYPTTFGHPRSEAGAELDREILGFVEASGAALVFGTYDLDAAGEYNAAAFLEPGTGLVGTYRKTHPFPFTEHVPAWMDGPRLRRWLPWTGSWQPGDGARVMPLRTADGREVNVVPLICLDDVHPGLAIDGARLGAQAIIGLSNDSWFSGHPDGTRLHLQVAVFRSIETRLPQLRVTTNGLSAIIDDTGEVLAHTGIGDQAVLTGMIAAHDPPPTLMVAWGDWVGRAGALFLLGLAALAVVRALMGRAAPARRAADADGQPVAVVLLAPQWRAATAALRVIAGLGLLWLAVGMLRHGFHVHSLSQLWWFGGVVVVPAVAAWAIQWVGAAQARVENGKLVLDQRHQRIEVPVAGIRAVEPWRLPLPGPGLQLQLATGQRWRHGIALARPRALLNALSRAGTSFARGRTGAAATMALAELRAAEPKRWFDHAWLKFLVFPLPLALVAFRLHQYIAFGGPFGEYHTHGLQAYLTGLLIWWASWSLGMMLFAAALRVGIEALTLPMLPAPPAQAAAWRVALEWLGRLAYFIGVPAWLVLGILPG